MAKEADWIDLPEVVAAPAVNRVWRPARRKQQGAGRSDPLFSLALGRA